MPFIHNKIILSLDSKHAHEMKELEDTHNIKSA
jgi:hypothetical protein